LARPRRSWSRCPGGRDPDQDLRCLLTGRQGRGSPGDADHGRTDGPPHRQPGPGPVPRGGFVGTSIADLAGALGVSKAAIYYHYRSNDALLRHLIDPLLDAIDACVQDRTTPAASAQTVRQLLDGYLAVLLAHREVVPLITTDVAILNHPSIGPRLHAQNQQLQSLLATPDPGPSARLRAEAALGAIWRPLIAEPQVDLNDPAHQHTLIDAAVATLQPNQPSPDGKPIPAPDIGPHGEHGGSTGR
jgi:AcrR family transcriptional regulator